MFSFLCEILIGVKRIFAIEAVNFPDSVTTLGKYAFRDCSKLQSVTIPSEISTHWTHCGSVFSNGTYNYYHGLAEGVFYNCNNLKKVIFKKGKSTQLIGANTFTGCSKLEKVILPDNIKFIDDHAFYNCENLTQINLQYVQGICIGAFENCSKLKTVQFPKDNINISKNAFQNCTSLESISLSGTSGYQIQYSLYKNFKKSVTKTLTGNTKTSITVSRLKRKKRYYVRVRAYRNANSEKYYGKWSKTKSIVVK